MISSTFYQVVAKLEYIIKAMLILSQSTLSKVIYISVVAGGHVVVVMHTGLMLSILVLIMKIYVIYIV